MKKSIIALASTAMLFAACQGSDTASETTNTETPAATETPAPTEPTAPASAEAVVTLNAGDDMKFDTYEIKVKEGQTVKLTLNHTGKAPVAAMGHNFVLLAQGTDMAAFAKDAIAAKATDYIPAAMAKDVIAHTKTIGGGESTTVEFKAPAKGTYDFLCSFPGHFATMQGQLIVE